MAKPEWGEKHRCSSCGKPFYDMQKNPIVCPSCGTENVPEKLLKPRKSAEPAKAPKAPEKPEEANEDNLLDDEEILETEDNVNLPDDEEEDDLSGVVAAPVKDEDL